VVVVVLFAFVVEVAPLVFAGVSLVHAANVQSATTASAPVASLRASMSRPVPAVAGSAAWSSPRINMLVTLADPARPVKAGSPVGADGAAVT